MPGSTGRFCSSASSAMHPSLAKVTVGSLRSLAPTSPSVAANELMTGARKASLGDGLADDVGEGRAGQGGWLRKPLENGARAKREDEFGHRAGREARLGTGLLVQAAEEPGVPLHRAAVQLRVAPVQVGDASRVRAELDDQQPPFQLGLLQARALTRSASRNCAPPPPRRTEWA
jgi:hypothetical protein